MPKKDPLRECLKIAKSFVFAYDRLPGKVMSNEDCKEMVDQIIENYLRLALTNFTGLDDKDLPIFGYRPQRWAQEAARKTRNKAKVQVE